MLPDNAGTANPCEEALPLRDVFVNAYEIHNPFEGLTSNLLLCGWYLIVKYLRLNTGDNGLWDIC